MRIQGKVLSGILSFWPLVYVLSAVTVILSGKTGHLPLTGYGIPWWIYLLMVLHLFTGAIIVWQVALSLFDLAKRENISGSGRIVWGVSLVLFNVVTVPVYWAIFLRKGV